MSEGDKPQQREADIYIGYSATDRPTAGINPLVSTVSGHPQFLALWCKECKNVYVRIIFTFGQLNLGKVIKTVLTSCQIWKLKYTKFDLGWGSAPYPAGGAYSTHPDPLVGFKGTHF